MSSKNDIQVIEETEGEFVDLENGNEKKPARTILIHLTDTHIGSKGLDLRRARFILDHLYWYYSQEKNSRIVVVHTGDIVDKGSKVNLFEETSKVFSLFVNRMKEALGDRFRFFICVGNHDVGNGLRTEAKNYENFRKGVTSFCDNHPDFFVSKPNRGICESVEDYGGLRYILLNSIENVVGGSWASGELGEVQRKWLEKVLEDSPPERRILIFLHHHPFRAKNGFIIKHVMNSSYFHALKDEEEFTNILRRHKSKILGVIFGHRHWREFVEIEGVNTFEDKNTKVEENASKPFLYSGGSTTHGPRLLNQRNKIFDEFRFSEETGEFYERNKWQFKSMYIKKYHAKMFRTRILERRDGEVSGTIKRVLNISRNIEDMKMKRPVMEEEEKAMEKEEEKANSFSKYAEEVQKVVEEERKEGEEEENDGVRVLRFFNVQ